MSANAPPLGELLREWRRRRRMSQLDLACEAEISARHLSFLETGRSRPSRDMVLRLADHLDVPLRERNQLLVAAGLAPEFSERKLQDPGLRAARAAIELILKGHEPYPALAVDRHWTLISANAALGRFMTAADPELLQPPVNVLRLSLHPRGLAPSIVNLAEWRAHILARLRRQIELTADPALSALMEELAAYKPPAGATQAMSRLDPDRDSIAVPLRLRTALGTLSFFSTTTVFGTPVDITLSELALEAFYPADETTAEILRQIPPEPDHSAAGAGSSNTHSSALAPASDWTR